MVRLTSLPLWPALAAGLALLAAALPAQAARVAGLYQAEVEFDGSRDEAFAQALGQVLVRITGRPDITQRQEAQALLGNAAAFAQQFRQPAAGRLWAAFDGAALERELARLGLPVWGPERPSTLLWIAVDAGGGQRFVVASGAEFEAELKIRAEAEAAAARRGIPLLFPLMDAEDRLAASFVEVWGGFEDSVLAASARYGADAVLVGRLGVEDYEYGRWTFLVADDAQRWSGGIGESVERIADQFAARFAVVSAGETRSVRLSVRGLASLEDYGRVNRFLEGLTAVEAVSIESLDAERAVFRVRLRGDAAVLDEAIRLGGVLQPEPGRGPQALDYQVAR